MFVDSPIKQNQPEYESVLLPEIQKIGCFFRSAVFVAENLEGKYLKPYYINRLWERSKDFGYIDQYDDVVRSAEIINLTFKVLSSHHVCFETGKFEHGQIDWWGWVKNSDQRYRRIDALIQKRKTTGEIGTHFVVVDKQGNTVFDPYYGDYTTIGVYYSILYHIQ